jgi:hypothetical protein
MFRTYLKVGTCCFCIPITLNKPHPGFMLVICWKYVHNFKRDVITSAQLRSPYLNARDHRMGNLLSLSTLNETNISKLKYCSLFFIVKGSTRRTYVGFKLVIH